MMILNLNSSRDHKHNERRRSHKYSAEIYMMLVKHVAVIEYMGRFVI